MTEPTEEVKFLREKLAQKEIEIEKLKGELLYYRAQVTEPVQIPDSATVGGV